jgi:phage baseplate assembly protein W
MSRKQYFDIKYPFTDGGTENYVLDLNSTQKDRVASDILHVIFTPKGQRLRSPNFGTDLIKYIFQPNDSLSWGNVKKEIQETVSKWVSGVILNNIEVLTTEDGMSIYVRIDYSVKQGKTSYNNSIAIEI